MVRRTTLIVSLIGALSSAVIAALDIRIDFVSTLAGSPDAGRSIGLQKLSADERTALNELLNRVYTLGRQGAPPATSARSSCLL